MIGVNDEMENISMDEISILGILQIQENWAGRNFITNSRVYSLLITQAKMQTEINNN